MCSGNSQNKAKDKIKTGGKILFSNHRRLDCFLNHLCRRRSKKTSKLRIAGLGEGNPPVTDGFPSQRASNAENVSIWWRHYGDKI